MPEADDELAYRTISVPIDRWSEDHRVATLDEVWHHGRAIETAVKANVLLKMAEQTAVPIEDLQVEWRLTVSVKGVTVPLEYLEDVTGPEDLEARIQAFQTQAQSGLTKSPGWASDLRFDLPTGPLSTNGS